MHTFYHNYAVLQLHYLNFILQPTIPIDLISDEDASVITSTSLTLLLKKAKDHIKFSCLSTVSL